MLGRMWNTENSHICWWECKLTHRFGKLFASIYPKGINAHPVSQQFPSKVNNLQNAYICSPKDMY